MKANPPATRRLRRPASASGLSQRATRPGNRQLAGILLLTGALSACSVPQSAPPAIVAPPPKASRPAPAPAPVTDWRTAPLTAGNWIWSMDGGQSTARFGGNIAVLRCDPAARSITLTIAGGGAVADDSAPLTVSTSTVTRTLVASRTGSGWAVTLASADPLLDAIAFSRGRFAIDASGGPSLRLPSWPEISRTVEDCR